MNEPSNPKILGNLLNIHLYNLMHSYRQFSFLQRLLFLCQALPSPGRQCWAMQRALSLNPTMVIFKVQCSLLLTIQP